MASVPTMTSRTCRWPRPGRSASRGRTGRCPCCARSARASPREQPLAGLRVAACLHVTSETANLVLTLIAGGAQVELCASNPLTTQDDVAAALVGHGVAVHAIRGESEDAYGAHVIAAAARAPQVTLDDGADLLSVLHAGDAAWRADLIGGTEETTTGLVRLRALQDEGRLRCPVLAVNEALTERTFNDRYGTGQSTLDGILRATNLLLAGRTVVVLGYGWTGKGVALRARGAGASVIVCEVDPMRALEARMDGCEVMPALEAAARGDVFITVTGGRDVLAREHFERMKDGAMLANAGHFDVEIAVDQLASLAVSRSQVLPLVEQFELGPQRRLNLIAQGPRRQPRGRRGPPGRGHGHVVRQPGAVRRAPRAARRVAASRACCRCPARSTARSRA